MPPLPTDAPAAAAKSRKKSAADEGPEPTVFPRKPVQTDVGIDDIVNRVNAASATAKIAEGVSKAAAVVDG
ncbi:MAG TPA: hypothetical protein DEF14_07795, partial [Ruminococcaceae bacterium]|nr:hypothetical protein [Oscillospiraceae bacterium]